MKKIRIINEIKKYNKNQSDHIYIGYDDDCSVNGVIWNKVHDKIVIVKFLIHDNYPFQAPTVLINNYNYIQLLAKIKTNDKTCECCSSILCNWGPTCSLIDIIKEIEQKYIKVHKQLEIMLSKYVLKQRLIDYEYDIILENIKKYI